MRATDKPFEGKFFSLRYLPWHQSGSAMMAWRPISWKAMFWALWREAAAMVMAQWTVSGYLAAHSRASMPPMDAPVTAKSFLIPRCSMRSFWEFTISLMVMMGKSRLNGSLVSGFKSFGPYDPMQPPNTLAQMMKYFSVSMVLPGPTMCSHQPAFFVTGWGPMMYWSPVRP